MCSVVLAKIVDGRFDLRRGECGASEELFLRFFPTIEDDVSSRVKKRQLARGSNLLGATFQIRSFTRGQLGKVTPHGDV